MFKKIANTLSSLSWLDYLWLSILILVTYGLFLGAHPLLVPDEARYSEVAREMLAQHQYITPQVNGIDFFDKPILFYWLQVASMAILGCNEWAIRLAPMLLGLVGLLVVYGTCNKLYGRQIAWISTLVLASCPLYYFAAHYANLDLEVAVWITASLCFFIRAYDAQQQTLAPKFLYLAYAAAGLAVLTKGLIGIVFPMMVIGLWIMLTRQWRLIPKMRIVSGLLLTLLITLPWFIVVEHRNPGFSYYFFYIQQFLRFLTANFNNVVPFWFYLPVVLIGLLPWSPFLYEVCKRKNNDVISLFFIIWAAAIFVFFSIPHSKLIGYIIPVIPPLAILIGRAYVDVSAVFKQRLMTGYLILFLILDIGLWCIPHHWREALGITLGMQLVSSALLTVLILLLLFLQRHYPQWSFGSMVFANFVIFNGVLASFLMFSPTTIATFFPVKTLVAQLKPILKPTDKLVSYYTYYQDLPMYAQQTILIAHDWTKPGLASVDNWRGEFAYSMQYLQPDAKNILISPQQLQQLWRSQQRVFVFLAKHKLDRWYQEQAPDNTCLVAATKGIRVLTNDMSLCHGKIATKSER